MEDKIIQGKPFNRPARGVFVSSLSCELSGDQGLDQTGKIEHRALAVVADDPHFQGAYLGIDRGGFCQPLAGGLVNRKTGVRALAQRGQVKGLKSGEGYKRQPNNQR